MRPKIALTFRSAAKAFPYQRALSEAGLEPVPFTPDLARDAPGSLDRVSGLVLTGGSDIDPAIYGAEPHPESGEADRERDDYESWLLRAALARDLPVLAICRGLQLFNVVRGGTLIQHLPNTDKHRRPTGGNPVHEVALDREFVAIFGVDRMAVNSRHHQAVDRLGEGLVVAAHDPEDRVIEGFVLPGASFAIAVQWHPEDMVEVFAEQRALFAGMKKAIGQRSGCGNGRDRLSA